jgi:hypothetical protein
LPRKSYSTLIVTVSDLMFEMPLLDKQEGEKPVD